jgi:hypothetical protein
LAGGAHQFGVGGEVLDHALRNELGLRLRRTNDLLLDNSGSLRLEGDVDLLRLGGLGNS